MPEQRILVASPLWAHAAHSVRAANIVIYELLTALAAQEGHKIGFLKLDRPDDPPPTAEERDGLDSLRGAGIDILPPWRVPPLPLPRRGRAMFLSMRLEDFYPEIRHAKSAHEAAVAFKPDLLFIPWSEWATALFATASIRRKFAYYGNPDHKSYLLRAEFDRRHGGSLVNYLFHRLQAARLERLHLDVLSRYDYVADVAANDARYYREKGIDRAFYIQNLWIDRFNGMPGPIAAPGSPVVIGNIGKVFGTANSWGLELLGREVLPALAAKMNGRPYEVHILGSGTPHLAVAKALQRPEIRLRGFVDDIDLEMRRAAVFLCVNNGTPYNVGHTRYLHAWSLGCCVVAHSRVREAMPELVHGENCLLGSNADEIAARVAEAIADEPLRTRLGAAGYRTFRERFVATKVVSAILDSMNH